MLKNIIFISLVSTGFILSCTSHTQKETDSVAAKIAAPDSASKQLQSQIDKIVDDLAPPDSDYTGEFFQKYENGMVKTKGYFRLGKRHGQWFYFYPNGYIWSEAFYDNGKMNGKSKVYSENGKLYYEGDYKQDIAVGLWRFCDSTGTPIKERTYDSLGKVLSDKDLSPIKK
jgi:hypothetical protein